MRIICEKPICNWCNWGHPLKSLQLGTAIGDTHQSAIGNLQLGTPINLQLGTPIKIAAILMGVLIFR